MRGSHLLVLLALASSGVVVAQPSQQSLDLAKTVPIADVHMHTYKRNGPQANEFLEQMDMNGIVWGGAVGDYREDVAQLLGKRYIPAVGQAEFMQVFFSQGEAGLIDENHPVFVRFYEEADRLLAEGKAKGFGELHTDNHNSGPKNIQRHIRTDNRVMRRFYEIASKHDGFVQIHSQLDDDFVGDVLRLTADYPRVLTVLSHCLPLSRPSDLENLFNQRPNLVCELSAQGYVHNKLAGIKRLPRVHTENGIKDRWKRLIEKFPDRVMVGTDACCGWFSSYSDMVKEIRNNLLPSLEPEVMEKVAYKNAVRLFQLTPP
jgi:predicted TIM-barrel fold metal-dependent hydrolase